MYYHTKIYQVSIHRRNGKFITVKKDISYTSPFTILLITYNNQYHSKHLRAMATDYKTLLND